MNFKNVVLNLTVSFFALLFGLACVGFYQFVVGNIVGDEVRSVKTENFKKNEFNINDSESVLPIDFEEDKLSDPKEDEDNPKYFDPEGVYFILDDLPDEFNRFESFVINNKILNSDEKGNYIAEDIALKGYVHDNKKYEFERIEIKDGKIQFQTKIINGVNFSFIGEFLVKGNFYTLDENAEVVKGTLTKKLGDKTVVLHDVSFGWMLDF